MPYCKQGPIVQRVRELYFPSVSPTAAITKLPVTSAPRLAESTNAKTEKTILYLAYGSNLSAETFKGTRGIKPLSAVNVHVPSLDLTFDLAGIPYIEPCFANTRYRSSPPYKNDYHKDRWQKGLIGVVYEVTPEDYRTIIATEGGGASYQDVIVPCYALPPSRNTVDPQPSGAPFRVHTLYSPPNEAKAEGRISRPDPSYAQASARYLKLITDGAEEHELPAEYLAYLYDLRAYTITTYRQRAGQVLFLTLWSPFVMTLLGFTRLMADEEGKIPKWLAHVTEVLFRVLWASYDNVFKGSFGDGERTLTDKDEEESTYGTRWSEKSMRSEQKPGI